jgi:ribonuclease HII
MPRKPHRPPSAPHGALEKELAGKGYSLVAGVDEVGRGPLAGPVVAGAVILGPGWEESGLNDSKKLSPKRREELAVAVSSQALAWAVGWADPEEVDRLNIHHASLLSMQRAVAALRMAPDYLLIDGRFTLPLPIEQQAVVGGDGRHFCIAAASILAKVHRDRLMGRLHQQYPLYNFAANKGYGTAEHKKALLAYGPCPLHRRSYGPVAQRGLFGERT